MRIHLPTAALGNDRVSIRHRPIGFVEIPDPFGAGSVDVVAAVALVGLLGVEPIETELAVHLFSPHIRLHDRSLREVR